MITERLDFLSVTDADGTVLLRAGNPLVTGDSMAAESIVAEVLAGAIPVVGTTVLSAGALGHEGAELPGRAQLMLVETEGARPIEGTVETDGLVLLAAAPVLDYAGDVTGVLYGGLLLNSHVEIVDKIKETVFRGIHYKGKDVGTATIFQDDVRISTNVLNDDGTRAIGTRIAEAVYDQVAVGKAPAGATPTS